MEFQMLNCLEVCQQIGITRSSIYQRQEGRWDRTEHRRLCLPFDACCKCQCLWMVFDPKQLI